MAAASRYCPSCLSCTPPSALSHSRTTSAAVLAAFLHRAPQHQTPIRTAVQSANAAKYKRRDVPASQKRKKAKATYHVPDLKNAIQFSLVDAMRYLRAAEVGRPPTSSKYELHLRLKTSKNGAVVRNHLRLPHPVKTDLRICVIANPESPAGKAAKEAGVVLVGEESVFEQIKQGKIDFDRCICHVDSLPRLGKSGVARILGPRGLMPSAKLGTVVKDVAGTVRAMVGGSEYRERMGTVRIAIGQLGFTPEQMQKNIRAFVDSVRKDMAGIADKTPKDIHEVVLSSTNGPGMSLSGDLRGANSVAVEELSGPP